MIRLAVCIMLAVLAATVAFAHGDWYASFPECCSGHDCRAANDGEVVEAPDGYRVVPSGEVYPYRHRKVRPSPDGKVHRCLKVPSDIRSETLCLFVVGGGV